MVNPTPTPEAIRQLAVLLHQAGAQVDGEDLADILWLADQIGPGPVDNTSESEPQDPEVRYTPPFPSPSPSPAPVPRREEPKIPLTSPHPSPAVPTRPMGSDVPIQIPAAPALRAQLDLARALRPLMRKIPSPVRQYFDEEATAIRSAEHRFLSPVLLPAPERRFDLALVIESSPSLEIWRDTITELQELVQQLGVFRQLRTWALRSGIRHQGPTLELRPNWQHPAQTPPCSPEILLDPTQRRLIWIVSDCTSELWDRPVLYHWLHRWGQGVTILQLLPERLWFRTALNQGEPVRIEAAAAATRTTVPFRATPIYPNPTYSPHQVTIPVISLEPEPFKRWAKVTTAQGEVSVAGRSFDGSRLTPPDRGDDVEEEEALLTPEQWVHQFSISASLTARRLAGLMAAVPVSLPIANLIQQTLLPQSRQVHVAEVFMSGLIYALPDSTDPIQYDFIKGVRDPLRDSVPIDKTITVLDTLSAHISSQLGFGIKSFSALIRLSRYLESEQQQHIQPFAEIGISTLRRLGGHYRSMAEDLAQIIQTPTASVQFPLETFSFEVVWLDLLQVFEFEIATLKKRRGKKKPQWVINKTPGSAAQFVEDLGMNVVLEMVEIPGGEFMMGSPEDEPERYEDEGPQHQVIVSDFFMSKYPITQAQWRTVAIWEPIDRDLDPDPADFKYHDRPVERISWYEAVEFCNRLAQRTGRAYRLPSEAEWEYACRAGTTTPFHFGETITTDLANYAGSAAYGSGPKGIDRNEITAVGSFGVANAFGLYDMHGNVLEWCADPWHENYEGAPKHGTIWEEGGIKKTEETSRLLRGGSWIDDPRDCRSASRNHLVPGLRNYSLGFRVCCGSPR